MIRQFKVSCSHYYNYKHTPSAILTTIGGPNYEYIYAEVRTNGRVNNEGVLNKSAFTCAVENKQLSLPTARRLPGIYIFCATSTFFVDTKHFFVQYQLVFVDSRLFFVQHQTFWHGVKVGPRSHDVAARDPGAQDLGPLSKFQSGTPGPLSKFQSGTPGPPSNRKNETFFFTLVIIF